MRYVQFIEAELLSFRGGYAGTAEISVMHQFGVQLAIIAATRSLPHVSGNPPKFCISLSQ